MKTQIKIVKFWIGANYNQLFILTAVVYFIAQILRILI